jgi:hypothetical protein
MLGSLLVRSATGTCTCRDVLQSISHSLLMSLGSRYERPRNLETKKISGGMYCKMHQIKITAELRSVEREKAPRNLAPSEMPVTGRLHKHLGASNLKFLESSESEAAKRPLKLPRPIKMGSGSSKPAAAPTSQVWTR